MHRVLDDYRMGVREERTYIDVDCLPIPPAGSQSSRSPFVPSPARPDDAKDRSITITLNYADNYVYRRVAASSSNLNIHQLALGYLMEVFDILFTSFTDVILTCEDQEVPLRGLIADIPIVDGSTVEIAIRSRGNRTQGPNTTDKVQSSCPGGSSRGYHREESHSLTSARASSRPGKNGEACPRGSQRGYQREESHSLTSVRASRSGNNGEAFYDAPDDDHHPVPALPTQHRSGGPYDKIKQSFKCPRFSGQQKDWKQWNKGFVRYLSIWDLEHVLDPDFVEEGYPLSPGKQQDNKMVFLLLEDAVQSAPMASSYVRQAPAMNGFEAYYTLHDGFVFAGSTTSTLLLNELSNFRFLPNETPTALVLRLEELFQELELLPSDAAVTFIDTQKIGYLLNALRHEEQWNVVSSYITSAQIKGQITFREACEELKVRCETARAHDMLDRPVKGKKVKNLLVKTDEENPTADQWTDKINNFISTVSKRLNLSSTGAEVPGAKSKKKKNVQKECLADGCDQQSPFALCGIHYHSLVSAKIPSLKVRNGYGDATYNASTQLIEYPTKTPADRLPSNAPRKVKVGFADGKA
jgi:hypothetical protein